MDEKKNSNENRKGIFYLVIIVLFLVILGLLGQKERIYVKRKEMYQKSLEEEQILAKRKMENSSKPECQKTSNEEQQTSIRVLLSVDGTQNYLHPHVQILSEGRYCLMQGEQKEIREPGTINMEQLLSLGQTVQILPLDQTTLSIASLERAQGTPQYEGTLEVTRTEQGFLLINELPLETYLKYVVPSEMPASSPFEALCAQAVCARTYAVRQILDERMREWGADVDDTVSCQVYQNIKRFETSDRAVDATKGEILCWNGQPIEAYFFSTSWGFTDTDIVWGNETSSAYLKSVAVSKNTVQTAAGEDSLEKERVNFTEASFCQSIQEIREEDYEKEDAWYRWNVTIPWGVLEERSQQYWPELGTLEDISVLERNPGGGVRVLKVTGRQSSVLLENEYEIRKFLSVKDLKITRLDKSICDTMELLPSACFMLEKKETEEGRGWFITGGGYGHGVGMSQNAARHLAEEGMGWREILKLFYQDIIFANLQES